MSTSPSPSRIAAVLLVASAGACAAPLEDPSLFFLSAPDAAVGGGGADGGGGGGGCDVPSLFSGTCAVSGCHSTKDTAEHLDLEATDPFGRLAGKKATGGNGVIIDDRGDPNKSVLYLKLKAPPPYGSRMPMNGPMLDDATIACVADWIQGQAQTFDGGSGGGDIEGGMVSDSGPGGGNVGSEAGDDSGSGTGPVGGPTEGGMDAGGVSFTQVYSIVQSNCLPCHATGDGKNTGMLDMSSQATAYMNLVGVMAAGSQCGSSGETRVVAGNSAMSLLYQIVNPNPPCGSQMPDNAAPLMAADIASIGAWIDQGAPNN